MSRFRIIVVLFAMTVVVIGAFIVGAQTEQKLDLGLEKEFPSIDDSSKTAPAHPEKDSWIELSENAALKVVGYRDGYVVTELMIRVKDEWVPAKVRGPGTGHEFAKR